MHMSRGPSLTEPFNTPEAPRARLDQTAYPHNTARCVPSKYGLWQLTPVAPWHIATRSNHDTERDAFGIAAPSHPPTFPLSPCVVLIARGSRRFLVLEFILELLRGHLFEVTLKQGLGDERKHWGDE